MGRYNGGMHKHGLLQRLEKCREVLNACIDTVLNERVCKEDMEEALPICEFLLKAAREELNATDETSYDADTEELYDRSVEYVTVTQKASCSLLQKKFRIGYGRAARIMDMMVEREVITPASKTGRHKVLPSVE